MDCCEIDCCTEDAHFCFKDGEFEANPLLHEDPVLQEKVLKCVRDMESIMHCQQITNMLTRVEHGDKFYKVHCCCSSSSSH